MERDTKLDKGDVFLLQTCFQHSAKKNEERPLHGTCWQPVVERIPNALARKRIIVHMYYRNGYHALHAM